jgi:hypothetical protein
MISIQTNDGHLIKTLSNFKGGTFGFHKLFGFISEARADQRMISRKRQSFDYSENKWNFSFDLSQNGGEYEFKNLNNCEVVAKDSKGWTVKSEQGTFKILKGAGALLAAPSIEIERTGSRLPKHIEAILLALLITAPILFFMFNQPIEDEKVNEIKDVITVKIVKKENVVSIKQNNPKLKAKPLTKAQKSKIAVQKNLGFLSMVGSKDLSKVVGGVPQKLKAATAGAGKGGDAGSGGELLTGLGKGLKKTTVGNTGVAGLGGVGTKGAGGGKGGYGSSLVASGTGKGISAIAVSNSNLALEGGLSRYAINATIAKYLSQVRRCYETSLKTNPAIQGLVEVSFMINGSGQLDFSKVKRSTLNHPATEQCITTKMMNWQFPKPRGGVKVPVNYPFMLRPVGR